MGVVKIVLTGVITLGIIVFLMSYLLGTKIDIFNLPTSEKETGNLTFLLVSDKIPEINQNVQNTYISMVPAETSLKLDNGEITSANLFNIYNYTGVINITGKSLFVNGTITKIETDSLILNTNKIEGTILFTNLTLNEFYMNEMTLSDVTGKVKIKGSEILLSNQNVSITSVKGLFTFDDKLSINGYVSELSIPTSGILVK